MKYTIEVLKKSKRLGISKYYWRLVHRNGNILAHSEIYSNCNKALQTAKNVYLDFKIGKCKLIIDKKHKIYKKCHTN